MGINDEEREKAILRSRRIALADQESNRAQAELNAKKAMEKIERKHALAEKRAGKRGREEGIKEGREEGIIDIAKNLLLMGMPTEQIAMATGLTGEAIEALRDAGQ